ncbi:signal peptidase I [Bdellovibrio sp. 22V]|uniref:signal peptidase I n=1 Tax=Bdellovibrio TaxID=958 RepID=UPI002543BE88|nr:signal peptidase I [Bdellovibrio sp. 22V]WII73433.1 signal peptidase I [Bdellovibrio sp. 22V]
MNRWREYFTTLVLAVLFALFVRNFLVTAYKVPTGSMQPTLKPGDFIFSSRISYGFPLPFSQKKAAASMPERGDVVVFSYPNQPSVIYVKRVVGLPGDRVQIIKGRLFLNEEPLQYEKMANNSDNPNPELFDIFEESTPESKWRVIFQKNPEDKDFGPLVVPPGEVFLLGDNRDASDDSRYWGTVPMAQVVGRVVLIWLSLDWQKKWGGGQYPSVRWNRVFSPVY